MGTHFKYLGVCVPHYDDLDESGMVCAFEWNKGGFFLGKPITGHCICGLADGHEGDHKSKSGATLSQNAE